MASILWETVEDALHAYVVGASGLAEMQVIWERHGGPRPDSPYIALSLDEMISVGHEWKRSEVVGDQLRVRYAGHRTARLDLQCFATPKPPANPGVSPVSILATVLDSIELYVNDLDAAGVGIGNREPVHYVPGDRGPGILEPRAVGALRIHLASEVETFRDYIERVQLNVHTADTVVLWVPDAPSSGFSSGFSNGFGI